VSERSDAAEFGLFELTRGDRGAGVARWVYPCRRCDVMAVSEAGGLCEACRPAALGEPPADRPRQ